MRATDGKDLEIGDLVRVVFHQHGGPGPRYQDVYGLLLRVGLLFDVLQLNSKIWFAPVTPTRQTNDNVLLTFGRSSIAEVYVLSRFSEALG